MTGRGHLWLATFLLAAAAPADDAYFPEPPPAAGEDLLPARTLGLVSVPDSAEFRRKWDGSSFGAMAEDPAFAAFFGDVLGRADRASELLGVDLKRLWAEVDGEVTLAVVPTARTGFSLVSVVDFGGDRAAAAAMVGGLAAKLRGEGAEPLTVEAGGREITAWTPGGGGSARLAYYLEDGRAVFGEGLESLAEIAGGPRGEPLSGLDAYRQVRRQTTPARGRAAARWYVNPGAVVTAAVGENLRGNPNLALLETMVEKSGVNSVRGFGGLFDLPGGRLDSVNSTYGYVPEPTGIVKALALPAERREPPDWVNEDVSLYGQIGLSPERFVGVVRELVDGVNGPGAFDGAVASLPVAGTETTVGDIAAQLSGPLHIAAEIPQSAGELTRQSTVLAVGVKDAAFAAEFARAVAAAGGAERSEAGGREVFTFPMSLPVPPQFAGEMASPELAVSVVDGVLVFATDGAYLERTLEAAASGASRPLKDSAAYREVADQFPERTSVITYQRQDERFAGLYEELRKGKLQAPGSVGLVAGLLGFDFEKLPPFAAMSRYLQTTGSYVAPAEDGFRIVSFSLEPREE